MAGPGARNKAIVRRLFNEGWNGDLTVFDQVIAEDFLVHFAAHCGEVLGIAGAKEMVADFQDALRGLHCRIEDLIAEQDRVAARVTYSGEGRSLSRIVILRLAGDRIVEAWED
ncbi:MAG: ester cyclase [Chloroflexota bacterium]